MWVFSLILLFLPSVVSAETVNNYYYCEEPTLGVATRVLTTQQGGTATGTPQVGGVLYSDADNLWTVLPPGSDDQVLTLSSGLPTWAASAGGGGGASALGDLSDVATTSAPLNSVLVLQSDGTFDLEAQSGGGDPSLTTTSTGTTGDTLIGTGTFKTATGTPFSLYIGGDLRTDGNATVTSNLTVSGNSTTTGNLAVSGELRPTTINDFFGAACSVTNEFATDIADDGTFSCTALDTSGTWSGNAGTATALAANGTNASAGNAILGVDASGNAEGEFDVWTEAENTAAGYGISNWTFTDYLTPSTTAGFIVNASSTIVGDFTANNLFVQSSTSRVGVATRTPAFTFQVGDQGAGNYFSSDSSGNTTSSKAVIGTGDIGDSITNLQETMWYGYDNSESLFVISDDNIFNNVLFSLDTSGNATTSGWLNIGATAGISELLGAGDLYVGGHATITNNLTVSGNATSSGKLAASGGNSDQWNTAFGWGDHSTEGYLTELDGHFAQVTTTDTVGGTLIPSANSWVTPTGTVALYLPSDLVVEGNATTTGNLIVEGNIEGSAGGSELIWDGTQLFTSVSNSELLVANNNSYLQSNATNYVAMTSSQASLVGSAALSLDAGSGNIFLKGGSASNQAILDVSNMATSDKTFTFPNVTGNICVDTASNDFTAYNFFTAGVHLGNASSSDLTVNGNATTTGWFNVGTTDVVGTLGSLMGAGDLFAGGNATTSGTHDIAGGLRVYKSGSTTTLEFY